MKGHSFSAFAPATVANLGLGFDVLGLALAGPGDTVEVTVTGDNQVRLVEITGDGGRLAVDAGSNTAGIAARGVLEQTGIQAGLEIRLHKGLPIGSGLGSSAASAAAAAFATNKVLGSPLRKQELLPACLQAEEAVSGRHADNVAPALLGGWILVRSLEPADLIRLPVPDGLHLALVTPAFELSTKEARAVLPGQIPLSALVHTTANLGAWLCALHTGDLSLLARCAPDAVITPHRARLIPGCDQAIQAALHSGALTSSVSGAGPSVFALCRSQTSARAAARAMGQAFSTAGLDSTGFISPADCPGARKA